LQSVYLAALPPALGELLAALIADRGNKLQVADGRVLPALTEQLERERWERHEVERLSELGIADTDRVALIRARRGQGTFRENVAMVEQACRITGFSNPAYLIASHIKPWRHAENDERLDRNNGLMLAPHADFLFDRGFISFADGRTLISDVADPKSLLRLGIDPECPPAVGGFNNRQEQFLDFHRREIFRTATR
jgi:putative restriction endonuclease